MQELLESRFGAQHVEVRLHHRIDQRGAAPKGTSLEQREGLLGVAALGVASSGNDDRSAVPIGRAAFPQECGEAVTLERACDDLRPFRRRHLLSQRHGFLQETPVTQRAFEPEQCDPEARIQFERPPRLRDGLVVAAGPIERAGKVRIDDQGQRVEIARALVFGDRFLVAPSQR